MTINYLKIKGLLTVNLTDGTKVGEIAEIHFDNSKRLKQLVLKSDNQDYVVVGSESIKGIGSSAAIVDLKNSPAGISAAEAAAASLINRTTISLTGEYLGKVTDFTLDTTEKKITSLVVKGDNADKPFVSHLDNIHTLGKDFIIITPEDNPVKDFQELVVLSASEPAFANNSLKSLSVVNGAGPEILSKTNIDARTELAHTNLPEPTRSGENRDQLIKKYSNEIVGKTLDRDIKSSQGRLIARAGDRLTKAIVIDIVDSNPEILDAIHLLIQ